MYVHGMIPHPCLVNLPHSYQQIHIILQSMTYYDPELGFILLNAILCALKTWYFLQEIGPHSLIPMVSTVTTPYLERRIIISLYIFI